jgi:hypothetical protein
MRILATAFVALILWLGWVFASVQFAANDNFGFTGSKVSGGQTAVLASLYFPAIILTLATLFMLIHLPFKVRKKKRAAAAAPVSTRPPAGWYPDPGAAGGFRWWDGNQWTALTPPPSNQEGTP